MKSLFEIYEVAFSDDGVNFSDFEEFVPGDVRFLTNAVKFRVTAFGDFEETDYRFRGFAGIADDATLTAGGFGLSPFGRFPFGDGGVCLQQDGEDLTGQLFLSGDLTIEANVTEVLTGELSLSGALTMDVITTESGSLSMSGALGTVLTNPSFGVLAAYGPTNGFTGTQNFSISTDMTIGTGASAAAVSFELPKAITITALYVKLDAVVSATHSVTVKFLVNGVVNNTFVVTIPAGSQVGSASGNTLVLNLHDTLGVQATSTEPSTSIDSFSAAYYSN